MSTAAAAHGAWMASFMIRSHHLSIAAAGLAMALGYSVAVALGTLICGPVTDRAAQRDPRWRVWLPMGALLLLCPVVIGLLLAPSTALMLPMLAAWAVLSGCVFAPMLGLCQALVSSRMRGTTVAIYHMLGNLIGIGVGAPLVGVLSDVMAPQIGQESLRYAMMVAALLNAWGGVHLYFASHTFRRDVARASGQPLGDVVPVAGG
jgi:MFS family permease